MKNLTNFIQEGLKIGKEWKHVKYTPKTKEELLKIIKQLIEERGKEADLNDIDTSKITDMSCLFLHSKVANDVNPQFDGDISKWDVSNVEDMSNMFEHSIYSGKNGNIGNWDVSKVKEFKFMFRDSEFEGDISDWDVNKDAYLGDMMFNYCPIENNQPKWYTDWIESRKKH